MDKNKRTKLRDGIAMIITGVIAVLMVFGVNVPVISDTVIGKVAYVIAFAISYAVNHYFNHNYSEEAKQSQELLDYYDYYAHGKISKREFLNLAANCGRRDDGISVV